MHFLVFGRKWLEALKTGRLMALFTKKKSRNMYESFIYIYLITKGKMIRGTPPTLSPHKRKEYHTMTKSIDDLMHDIDFAEQPELMTEQDWREAKPDFFWNAEYINSHTLSFNRLKESGITLYPGEVFVQYPDWRHYFISNYGRVCSTHKRLIKLLTPNDTGNADRNYSGYLFTDAKGFKEPMPITENKAVSTIFCPNFWKDTGEKLHSHHCDRDRRNNYYKNLILLPDNLHRDLHRIRRMMFIQNGEAIHVLNPLQICQATGLTPEDVIFDPDTRKWGRRKLGKEGEWQFYEIKGHKLAYIFKDKAKKSKKTKATNKESED